MQLATVETSRHQIASRVEKSGLDRHSRVDTSEDLESDRRSRVDQSGDVGCNQNSTRLDLMSSAERRAVSSPAAR